MQLICLNAALITLESELRYHRQVSPDFKKSPAELPIKPKGPVAVMS